MRQKRQQPQFEFANRRVLIGVLYIQGDPMDYSEKVPISDPLYL